MLYMVTPARGQSCTGREVPGMHFPLEDAEESSVFMECDNNVLYGKLLPPALWHHQSLIAQRHHRQKISSPLARISGILVRAGASSWVGERLGVLASGRPPTTRSYPQRRLRQPDTGLLKPLLAK